MVGLVSFAELAGFKDIWSGTKSLFQISMGGLSFGDFDSLFLIQPWFAHIYLFLVMVVTNITLLNFAIAILSNTYTILTEQATGIYM